MSACSCDASPDTLHSQALPVCDTNHPRGCLSRWNRTRSHTHRNLGSPSCKHPPIFTHASNPNHYHHHYSPSNRYLGSRLRHHPRPRRPLHPSTHGYTRGRPLPATQKRRSPSSRLRFRTCLGSRCFGDRHHGCTSGRASHCAGGSSVSHWVVLRLSRRACLFSRREYDGVVGTL